MAGGGFDLTKREERMAMIYGTGSFAVANSGNSIVNMRANKLADLGQWPWGSSITNLTEVNAPISGGVGSIEISTHPEFQKNGDLYVGIENVSEMGLYFELAMELEDTQGEMHWDISSNGRLGDGVMHRLPRNQTFDLYFFGTDFLPTISRADFGIRQGTHTTGGLAKWSLATLSVWGITPA